MAWIARENYDLLIYDTKPERDEDGLNWLLPIDSNIIQLPDDADEKLIGKHITYEDEPVEI